MILPFVVLRRLDCVLEPHKEEVYKLSQKYKGKIDDVAPIITGAIQKKFYNVSKFDLKGVTVDKTPSSLKLNFDDYLNGFSDNVQSIIEHFQLEKPIEKLHKNNRLFLLIF